MKKLMIGGCARACLAAAIAGAAWSANAETYATWKGADGAYLNDAANWDGDAPFNGTSANGMQFTASESKAYTVKLSDDLVSAGTWAFEDKPMTMTWDLNGHSMTFMTNYHSHVHQGWTNIFLNGTIAFTNATGTILESRFWHGKSGNAAFFRKAGYIGDFKFTDSGTKTLEVTDGTKWQGNIQAYGAGCRVTIAGDGTVVDLRGERGNSGTNSRLEIGGNGDGALLQIFDGAVVTNGSWLQVGNAGSYAGNDTQLIVSNATLSLNGKQAFEIGGSRVQTNNGVTTTNATQRNVVKFINGAMVDVSNSQVRVGNPFSNSNLLYVAGSDVVFTALSANSDCPFTVGQNSCWNTFHLTDGATMRGGYMTAGGQIKPYATQGGENGSVSIGNRILIDEGATLEMNGAVRVGWRHSDDIGNGTAAKSLTASNVFEIASGAKVTKASGGVLIGACSTAIDNTLVVRGTDTLLNIGPSDKDISIGFDGGSGNGIEILDGASVTNFRDLRIASETHYRGNTDLMKTASNNYARIENTTLEPKQLVYVGFYGNGGNKLIVGDGAKLNVSGVVMRGFGQEIVVSNGVLTTGSWGLQPGRTEEIESWVDGVQNKIAYTEGDSGAHRFSFYGQGRIVRGETNNVGAFTNGCVFAFHVPAGGYAAAPFESQKAAFVFSDDTEFEFDFSAAKDTTIRNVPLVSYTGTNAEASRIVMSDALLAKIDAAAKRANGRARVRLSADRKTLSVSISQGLMLIVR